ncbi:MAG: DUF177 domain-containing protein [Candidatus Goldbacteria bacterium]|nr:DUF177 domain-containing protein [Candidatus Goldiibacteriota bacterium]HPD18329.1 DUF177 domain-containing protein [Candidatus Goldiibacteriota bacterium]
MLKINITSFDFQKEFLIELKSSGINIEKSITISDSLKISVVLTKEKEHIIIAQGNVSGGVRLTCSRCLEEFNNQINNDFVAIFKDKKMMKKDDVETDVFPYENNVIDLYELIRETIIMEVPMKPLCKNDCAGLCPVCGKNLKREKCNCHVVEDIINPFKDINIFNTDKK